MEGLDIHQRGLVEGFFPGVAEGVVHPKPMGFTRILLATQPSDRPDGSKRLDQREVQRRRRRCWALRLYFSVGVSWWRRRLRSAKIPAFETCRLNNLAKALIS